MDTSGLLILVLDDREWNAHSANQLVGIGGAVTIAPRPVEPAHVPITAGMTNAQISVAKYTNDRHLIWHDARTALKNEIIRSLGPTLASTICPPPMGFTTIPVPQIVAAIKGFYGTIDQLALNKMEDILAGPLDSVGNLDKHLANMRQHMLMQTTAGYPIEEHRKVRIFRKSVLGLRQGHGTRRALVCIFCLGAEAQEPTAESETGGLKGQESGQRQGQQEGKNTAVQRPN